MSKLGTITLNGKFVTVFKPPHSEPDFPWIDVEELTGAWLSPAEAKAIVKMTHKYNTGGRPVTALEQSARAYAASIALPTDLPDRIRQEFDKDPGLPWEDALAAALDMGGPSHAGRSV